ncbi:MAG: hypothetical protein FJ286_12975 [Planctomycetes bacterium]|nr:hypothetical protein [Planctomycetota bacterium]
MTASGEPIDPAEAAMRLARALDARGVAYAIGGALAFGYWGMPRGTLDVDITHYMPPEDTRGVIALLDAVGCVVDAERARGTLAEHGFCSATLAGLRVDVFLPIVDFYTVARGRRRRVDLSGVPLMIWDAETPVIFKLMFFRDKDPVDIAQILRTQAGRLDSDWITTRLVDLFGRRDPRVSRWHELLSAAHLNHPPGSSA